MKSIFDLDKLDELLKDYYTVTEIRITVFDEDFNEITAYPKRRPALCEKARSLSEINAKCRECDKYACKIAAKGQTPYIYKCHLGLTEIILPLIVNKEVFGYLFFGNIFSFENLDEGVKEIYKNISKYGFAEKEVFSLCEKLPVKSNQYINASANLLSAVAAYLCLQKIAMTAKSDLGEAITDYIKCNFLSNISADVLCESFGIGRTKLYSIIKERTDCGLAEYVKRLRLSKAKELLEQNPDMKISEVAEKCGFMDYNYFIANFRSAYGSSPKKYSKLSSDKNK